MLGNIAKRQRQELRVLADTVLSLKCQWKQNYLILNSMTR